MKDLPTVSEIRKAQVRIAPYVWQTPLLRVGSVPLYLKMECWQRTGSFKVRGAFSKLLTLSKEELARGLVTASAGNHGIGVAEAARSLGTTCHVFVPLSAARAKIRSLEELGALLHFAGRDYDECEEEARRWARDHNALFVHAFDDLEVIAGQGTVGLEMIEQMDDGVRTLFVPVGGGGLIAGVASAFRGLRPDVRIIGVQPEASPAMLRALEAGHVVETPCGETLADGLAGRFVSERTLRACQRWVDGIVLVSEKEIRAAVFWLLDTVHTVGEGSAVVGIAAALRGKEPEPYATIVTGRNIDAQLLCRILREETNA
ncbi:MAG: threonine/serine dehydratase [candidate division KSB1 bacterium]|nr:threonine/serine dehydratase [candidate division KSB1 bacterium]